MKKMELPSALAGGSSSKVQRSMGGGGGSIYDTAMEDYSMQQLKRPPTMHGGIRTVLPIGEGSVITGGDDKYIRVWDGVDPKHSFPMCGPMPQNRHSQPQVSTPEWISETHLGCH